MTKLTMASKINQGNYEASKSVSELKNNGYFERDGETYILLEQAYIDGPWDDAAYFATAVKIGDEIIDGEVKTYKVEWEITNPDWKEAEDESYNCDWGNPVTVEEVDSVDVD